MSLDVLRGLAVAGMILVNMPGSWDHVYAPLRHAAWHGLTIADLVFPLFLFVMGAAIPLSLGRRLKTHSKRGLAGRIFWRACLLFAIGLVIAVIPHFSPERLRIPGVLQRIALVYLACGLLFFVSGWRGQAVIAAAILLGYWALLTLIPVPGIGPANLAPATNLAAWMDRQLIPGVLYQGSWDPEGLLSTLPAIGGAILGMLAGEVVRSELSLERKVIRLMIAGGALSVLGYFWQLVFPLNKALWTSSYAVLTTGYALSALGALMWLVDGEGWRKGTGVFVDFGRNALVAYAGHMLLAKALVWQSLGTRIYDLLARLPVSDKLASLLYALLATFVMWRVAAVLNRRHLHIRL